jgi:YHS domain-containing protein
MQKICERKQKSVFVSVSDRRATRIRIILLKKRMKKLWLAAALIITAATQVKAQKEEVFVSNSQAIHGYDPVAYFKENKPVKGNDQFSFQWKNAKWLFSSKENMNAFSQDPEKYAPQYGGYCAYGMSEGHKAPTDPNAWTIVEGKLYLNYSPKVKEMWIKNPSARIEMADKNWATINDKGKM